MPKWIPKSRKAGRTWKECGNCLSRLHVSNAMTKCPICGVTPMHKTVNHTPYEGRTYGSD